MKNVESKEGQGMPNAPFLSSERRDCNIRPFQQTGAFDHHKEYSKSGTMKVTKLRAKHLQELNK